jgi:hypothetical protein
VALFRCQCRFLTHYQSNYQRYLRLLQSLPATSADIVCAFLGVEKRTGRLPACAPKSKRARVFVSATHNCPRRCEKKFRWRRPRHTLKGRQIASEVDRIGLRPQLRKRQAEAGYIILHYGDESEALTHPWLARAWARSGADLRVPAPGQLLVAGFRTDRM